MKELKTFHSRRIVHAMALAAALAFGGVVAAPAEQGGLHVARKIPAGLTAADWASLREKIEASHHRAVADGKGGYVATDPWGQQAYLKASNTEQSDQFGFRVAISGDTVVVGARDEDSNATGVNGNQTNNSTPGSGAVYVFVRAGSTWSQRAYLKASNTDGGDELGFSVAISGDTVGVGAPGESSNATGVNGDQTNNSAGGAGAAYVFTVTQSVTAIPTLGSPGLAVLLLALATAGLLGLRRRPAAAPRRPSRP